MTIELTVPPLGESITEATVLKWLKTVGESFEIDEPLVEIETDKISNVLESPGSGCLRRITAHSGESLPVAALLGVIADNGELPNS